jgi:hypothetical protein
MKHRIAVAIIATLALSAGTAPSWAAGSSVPDARTAATALLGPKVAAPSSTSQTPPDVARPAGSTTIPDVAKPPIMGGPVRPPVNLPLPQGSGQTPPIPTR